MVAAAALLLLLLLLPVVAIEVLAETELSFMGATAGAGLGKSPGIRIEAEEEEEEAGGDAPAVIIIIMLIIPADVGEEEEGGNKGGGLATVAPPFADSFTFVAITYRLPLGSPSGKYTTVCGELPATTFADALVTAGRAGGEVSKEDLLIPECCCCFCCCRW